jgi:deazaflavin-dependent oxidoreductase (nitroreductase family)
MFGGRSISVGCHGLAVAALGLAERRYGSMPLPREMAKFNRRFTNRLTRHIAGWAPGFALVQHVGRRTGRHYETPVNVFVRPDRYVFALTYAETEWIKNVVAAGQCTIRTRRHNVQLANPERIHDPTRKLASLPARWILRLLGVEDFIALRPFETG